MRERKGARQEEKITGRAIANSISVQPSSITFEMIRGDMDY